MYSTKIRIVFLAVIAVLIFCNLIFTFFCYFFPPDLNIMHFGDVSKQVPPTSLCSCARWVNPLCLTKMFNVCGSKRKRHKVFCNCVISLSDAVSCHIFPHLGGRSWHVWFCWGELWMSHYFNKFLSFPLCIYRNNFDIIFASQIKEQ